MLTTTPTNLAVTAGSAPVAIGIAAPLDTSYSAAQLKVTVTGLPIDGTVYLSDGVTPLLPGQPLSVAQLIGLKFAGNASAAGQSSQLNYTVTDLAGASTSGSASLSVIANASGPHPTTTTLTVAENAGATPIGIAAPTDPNYGAGSLNVSVLGLPTDGAVYLADGTTKLTAGESLASPN